MKSQRCSITVLAWLEPFALFAPMFLGAAALSLARFTREKLITILHTLHSPGTHATLIRIWNEQKNNISMFVKSAIRLTYTRPFVFAGLVASVTFAVETSLSVDTLSILAQRGITDTFIEICRHGVQ